MIAGVGIDVVDLPRFAALLHEPGSVWQARTFTAMERAAAEARPSGDPTQHLAARFAAKEAFVKALSQSLAPGPLPEALLDLREVEVICDDAGRPALALHGRARALGPHSVRYHYPVGLLSHPWRPGAVATALVVTERDALPR